MRADAAAKDGVAVVEQVVRGNGGADRPLGLGHVLRRFAGGDVLKHHFERREIAPQGDELGVDEHRLAVKQVDIGRGHFAVHQQWHAGFLHGF